MAHLVKQSITSYVDASGKRVPKGTPGARRVRGKSSKWYGVGVPGYPPKKRVPLAADKLAARRMLDDLVRAAERGQSGVPDQAAARTSLADHLAAFEKDAALGLATRKKAKRVPSAEQVRLTVQRVRDALDGCGFSVPADLNDSAPAKLAAYLQGRVARLRKDGGVSHQTAGFILAAARRFAWWLARKRLPVRADLFDAVPGFDPDSNRVHARREIGPEELARVLEAALASGKAFRRTLAGSDRYHLYLVAFSSTARVIRKSLSVRYRRWRIGHQWNLPGPSSRSGSRNSAASVVT